MFLAFMTKKGFVVPFFWKIYVLVDVKIWSFADFVWNVYALNTQFKEDIGNVMMADNKL